MSTVVMQNECVLHQCSFRAQLTQIHGMFGCLLGLSLSVQLIQTWGACLSPVTRLSVQWT